eukprot:TRINITY_DN32407_c0_g1_i1.p1 TRINITY_DN32407_c0_g1~~TRINITY_DN32407_c0_g1_i1.p1  ORF type:complete len:430 (+),score=165.99 TRINITY_DN32407_c0_g1_i1:87-1376(+)
MPRSVLICGDGNFSFSLAVAKLQRRGEHALMEAYLGMEGPFDILCTSFDTREQLVKKYHECGQILPTLDGMGADGISVKHGVNAWELKESFGDRKFDAIIWNHPHLGTENFNLHRFLLCHFMHSAKQQLTDTPQSCVVLSVLEGQSVRWSIKDQGEKVGMVHDHTVPFLPTDYPGYETRRNRTGGSFQNSHTQQHTGDVLRSVTLRFLLSAGGLAAPRPAAAVEIQEAKPTMAKKPALRPFVCVICGKAFKKQQGLFTHTRQCHELKKYGDGYKAEGQALKCIDCGKTFPNEDALWQHRIASHTEDVSIPHPSTEGDETQQDSAGYGYFPCTVCGMSVSHHPDWGMPAHLESLKPIVGLELSCGINGCDKLFIEQRALRQHRNFCRVRERERAAAAQQDTTRCVKATLIPVATAAVLIVAQLWKKRSAM